MTLAYPSDVDFHHPKAPAEPTNRKLIASIDPSQLGAGAHLVEAHSLIVHIDADGEVRAAHNRCKHMGERLSKPKGCLLTCPRHGWILDAQDFTYKNPTGGVKHAELNVEVVSATEALIWENDVQLPWDNPPAIEPLGPGELVIEYFSHACMKIEAAGTTLFTDPWLTGPAFVRGWWLAHLPREDWLHELAKADALYISHNHSDHLNEPTLRALVELAPDIPIYVPAFRSDSCDRQLQGLGFRDIRRVPFDTWTTLPGGMQLLIMQDKTDREDSALLVQYKGHRILDAVDCANLGDSLPTSIDVLLSSFAGGASGFPVCWEELYGRDKVSRLVTRNRKTNRRAVMRLAEATRPKVFTPFAGFFTEAHPADAGIKEINRKNTPESICADLRIARPGIETWNPKPGERLDLATLQVSPAPAGMVFATREITPWLDAIAESELSGSLATLDAMQRYFDWAGYRGDLLLHVIETDESFEDISREFFYDTRTGQVRSERPEGCPPYLRMRVRRDVFHHVLRHGHSWEEISIGFQARFFRAPDTYHFDFWDHFQNRLPEQPINWAQRSAA